MQRLEDAALYIIVVLLLISTLPVSQSQYEYTVEITSYLVCLLFSVKKNCVHRQLVFFIFRWSLWAELMSMWWWTLSSPHITWLADHLGIFGIADTSQGTVVENLTVLDHEWNSNLLLSWGIKMKCVYLRRCSKSRWFSLQTHCCSICSEWSWHRGFRYSCLLDHWCLNELEQITLTFFGLLVSDYKWRWCTFEKFYKLCRNKSIGILGGGDVYNPRTDVRAKFIGVKRLTFSFKYMCLSWILAFWFVLLLL